jgi:hypothetical protein
MTWSGKEIDGFGSTSVGLIAFQDVFVQLATLERIVGKTLDQRSLGQEPGLLKYWYSKEIVGFEPPIERSDDRILDIKTGRRSYFLVCECCRNDPQHFLCFVTNTNLNHD